MVVECICVHVELSSRERKWCVEELEKVYDHGQYGRDRPHKFPITINQNK